MVIFLVVLTPARPANPDTDLTTLVPDLIESHSSGYVEALGWGYAPDQSMHLFFQAAAKEEGLRQIKAALESAPVKGNDLSSVTIAFRSSREGPFTVVLPAANEGQEIADISDA